MSPHGGSCHHPIRLRVTNSKSRKLTDFCCGHRLKRLKRLPPLKKDMLRVKGPDWAEGPTHHAACGTWAGTRVPGASATGHWAETPSAPQGLRREGGGTCVVGVCTGPSKAGSTCPFPTHPPTYLGGSFAAASSEPAARLRRHWTAGALPPGPGPVAAPLPPGLPAVGTGREDTAKETVTAGQGAAIASTLAKKPSLTLWLLPSFHIDQNPPNPAPRMKMCSSWRSSYPSLYKWAKVRPQRMTCLPSQLPPPPQCCQTH